MALKVTKMDVWVASLRDVPGALAKKLAVLAAARANLGFVLARREAAKPGRGVLFAAPLKGRRQLAAARKAGLRKSRSLHALRVEGPNRAGAGARITRALAEAGINLRGLSAGVVAGRFVLHLAMDKASDATKAARVLRKV